MTDRFDNDPAIQITIDGGELQYSGGQPLMDEGGLENAVTISLFSSEGWVGNALETDPDRMIGSDFFEAQGAPITSATIRAMEKSGERALQWLINVGIARIVSVEVFALTPKRIEVNVAIEQDDNKTQYFKYDLNWTASIFEPVINTGEPDDDAIPDETPPPPPVPVDIAIYLDSSAGVGTGDGSLLNPYGRFTELDWSAIAVDVANGDNVIIRLKRDSVWTSANAELVIGASGGEANPILIEPYDVGAKPKFKNTTADYAIRAIDKEYIILDGMWVDAPDLAGIRFDGLSKNNTFRNNYVEHTETVHGFYLIGTVSDPTTGNKFYNNYCARSGRDFDAKRMHGALFSYCDDSHIYQNEMYWNEGNGLYFSNCNGNTIEENRLDNNGGAGIYCNLSSNNTIRKNYFMISGARVLNQGHLMLHNFCLNNAVYMNVLEKCADYGWVCRDDSEGNLFYNNTVVKSGKQMTRQYDNGINNIFKNNIYWNNSDDWFTQISSVPNTFDYNIYWNTFKPSGDGYFVYGGGQIDWTGVGEWNPDRDPNGYLADPLLSYYDEDPLLSELWVTGGSPAIGNAQNLGFEYEERLDQTSAWIRFDELTGEILQASDVKTVPDPTTIGAYEYIVP